MTLICLSLTVESKLGSYSHLSPIRRTNITTRKIAAKLKESATSNPHKRTKVDVEVSKASPGTGNLLSPKLLEPFSINLKSLSKKDEYQILRIETEGGPLTPDEKLARREITSLRVTE